MSDNKFSNFNERAKEEASQKKVAQMPPKMPNNEREVKKNMTVVITPSNKAKFKELADSAGMSMSELLAFWIENAE